MNEGSLVLIHEEENTRTNLPALHTKNHDLRIVLSFLVTYAGQSMLNLCKRGDNPLHALRSAFLMMMYISCLTSQSSSLQTYRRHQHKVPKLRLNPGEKVGKDLQFKQKHKAKFVTVAIRYAHKPNSPVAPFALMTAGVKFVAMHLLEVGANEPWVVDGVINFILFASFGTTGRGIHVDELPFHRRQVAIDDDDNALLVFLGKRLGLRVWPAERKTPLPNKGVPAPPILAAGDLQQQTTDSFTEERQRGRHMTKVYKLREKGHRRRAQRNYHDREVAKYKELFYLIIKRSSPDHLMIKLTTQSQHQVENCTSFNLVTFKSFIIRPVREEGLFFFNSTRTSIKLYVHGFTAKNKPLLRRRDTSLLLDRLLYLLNVISLVDVDFDNVTGKVLDEWEGTEWPSERCSCFGGKSKGLLPSL